MGNVRIPHGFFIGIFHKIVYRMRSFSAGNWPICRKTSPRIDM